MHRIEQRLRRLERRRAREECDPQLASRVANECYDRGEPLPESLTGETRVIASAILDLLNFYDNQWSDEPLPLPALKP